MFCANCGQRLSADAVFCNECGTPVRGRAPAAVAPSAAAASTPQTVAAPARRSVRWYSGMGCLGVLLVILTACNILPPLAEVGNLFVGILILFAAILPALFYCGVVYLLDRHEREPRRVLVAAFLWGALVATMFGGIINDIVGGVFGRLVAVAFSAPISEEVGKGMALLILFFFLRKEFDNVVDGIVYGGLVGIGFAMTENVQYFASAYMRGDMAGMAENVYVRVVLGGFGHAAYTATFGAGLGYARETRSKLMKFVAPTIGLLAGIFQHFAWNGIRALLIGGIVNQLRLPQPVELFIVDPILAIIFKGPGIATLLVLAVLAWRREARIIHEQLQEEVARGVLTAEEFARLSSSKARLRAEWQAFKRWGIPGWSTHSALHHTAADLAFRKWHRSRGEALKGDQKVTPEETYRERLLSLRPRLATFQVA